MASPGKQATNGKCNKQATDAGKFVMSTTRRKTRGESSYNWFGFVPGWLKRCHVYSDWFEHVTRELINLKKQSYKYTTELCDFLYNQEVRHHTEGNVNVGRMYHQMLTVKVSQFLHNLWIQHTPPEASSDTEQAYLSNTPTNLCIALLNFLLFSFILYCYAFVQYCYVKWIQYNAMHKFVGVLDNPPSKKAHWNHISVDNSEIYLHNPITPTYSNL